MLYKSNIHQYTRILAIRTKFLIFVLLNCGFIPSLSFAIGGKLTLCPSVIAIKNKGLNYAFFDQYQSWCSEYIPGDKYGTSSVWHFWTAFEKNFAKDASEALIKANTALESLQLVSDPICNEYYCYCNYSSYEHGRFAAYSDYII